MSARSLSKTLGLAEPPRRRPITRTICMECRVLTATQQGSSLPPCTAYRCLAASAGAPAQIADKTSLTDAVELLATQKRLEWRSPTSTGQGASHSTSPDEQVRLRATGATIGADEGTNAWAVSAAARNKGGCPTGKPAARSCVRASAPRSLSATRLYSTKLQRQPKYGSTLCTCKGSTMCHLRLVSRILPRTRPPDCHAQVPMTAGRRSREAPSGS